MDKALEAALKEALTREKITTVLKQDEFWLEKGREVFLKFRNFPVQPPGFWDALRAITHSVKGKGYYDTCIASFHDGSTEKQFLSLAGKLTAYLDKGAAHISELNEYPDNRAVSKAMTPQTFWIKALVGYAAQGYDLSVIKEERVRNAVAFLNSPDTLLSITSPAFLIAISQLLFGKPYDNAEFAKKVDDLFQKSFGVKAKTPENLHIALSQVLFDPGVRKFWEEQKAVPPPAAKPAQLSVASKNVILYGPPGVGKTYTVIDRCLDIVDGPDSRGPAWNEDRRAEAENRFNELVTQGRIVFTTFHQSYSYEDFIEGIRPVRSDDNVQKFDLVDGVFKELCRRARTPSRSTKSLAFLDDDKTAFFKMSLGNTQQDEAFIYEYCMANDCIALGWGGDVDYSQCKTRADIQQAFEAKNNGASPFNVTAIVALKTMKKGDLVIVSQGNHKFRAIGRVAGEYEYRQIPEIQYSHFRKVEWLFKGDSIPVGTILKEKIFSQATIYQFSPGDFNKDDVRSLLTPKAGGDPENLVLVIDEINRGNISKIFGELITLLEEDKRTRPDGSGGLQVRLPYSQQLFGVPDNVYVLGTMNTADKSIALLDAALRRRFTFEEILPQPGLLTGITIDDVEDLDLARVLSVMNERIEMLYDRDHTIGHSYFLKLNGQAFAALREVFLYRIVPLLNEYFHDDSDKVARVLGCSKSQPGILEYQGFKMKMAGESATEGRWLVDREFGLDAVRLIYEQIP